MGDTSPARRITWLQALGIVTAFWVLLDLLAVGMMGDGEPIMLLVLPIGAVTFLPEGLVWVATLGVGTTGGDWAPFAAIFWSIELLLHYLFVRTRLWVFLAVIVALSVTSFSGCVAVMSRLPTNPFM